MPTYRLHPPTLADRLQALADRAQALARATTMQARALAVTGSPQLLSVRSRWQALPGVRRWQILAAAATALLLLTMYVMTLQAAVERGEKLREERRQQGLTAIGAVAPAVTLQATQAGATRT